MKKEKKSNNTNSSEEQKERNIIIAIDREVGFRVTNRGQWMNKKDVGVCNKKEEITGYLKILVVVDIRGGRKFCL